LEKKRRKPLKKAMKEKGLSMKEGVPLESESSGNLMKGSARKPGPLQERDIKGE